MTYTIPMMSAEDAVVLGDAVLEGSIDAVESAEDFIDDLTLDAMMAFNDEHEIVAWNGEFDMTDDGKHYVVREHRAMERALENILEAMLAHHSLKYDNPECDRQIDDILWSGNNVHSSDGTEICCECRRNLIHQDPYSGWGTSVFVDGEGLMCGDCCSDDPVRALEQAAEFPSNSSNPDEWIEVGELGRRRYDEGAETNWERAMDAGWRRCVVDETSVKAVASKSDACVDFQAPRHEVYTCGPTYRARVVWYFRRDRRA
jgi:hypothetical protein